MTVVLIDLSSLAYPIWHISQSEPDPNHASGQIVSRVRALAQSHKHVAVCVDSGQSFRVKLDPEYKGNRPERDERLAHQINLAITQLREDGFPIWGAAGFEADDLIATGVRKILARGPVDSGHAAVVVSADKDLLQLVDDWAGVVAMLPKDGTMVSADGVVAKFQVTPAQMRDFLTILGDKSDNIPGIKGIGEKGAATLLKKFGTLDNLYSELREVGGTAIGLSAAATKALVEFESRLPVSRALITLRDDAPISDEDFNAVIAERAPKPSTHEYADHDEHPEPNWEAVDEAPAESIPDAAVLAAAKQASEAFSALPEVSQDASLGSGPSKPPASLVRQDINELGPVPEQWERQLDPRSLRQAQALALDMYKSGMFREYGSPYAVLSTALVGREFGLPFMTSLRTVHVIEGRHALSAQLIVALVLRSGLAEYFEMDELTDKSCRYVTKRKGGRGKEQFIEHTLDMAATAGLMKPNSNWVKIPQDMLIARASVRLARAAYSDVVANVYTPDELAEMRTSERS